MKEKDEKSYIEATLAKRQPLPHDEEIAMYSEYIRYFERDFPGGLILSPEDQRRLYTEHAREMEDFLREFNAHCLLSRVYSQYIVVI